MEGDPGSAGPVLRGRRRDDNDDDEEEDSDGEELLVEEREAEMVSFLHPEKPSKRRKAWFLMSTGNVNVTKTTPFVPTDYKNSSMVAVEDYKFQFKGWCSSPRQWEQWVAKLLPKFGQIWRKVGIFDAILISTYRIRRDPSSIFGVVSHWCEETNTFLFPWGEVTVTLEDVIILSGLSVLGDPVKALLPDELREVEARLNEERLRFNRSTSKKAHHSAWMKVFMEREGDELEHAAFLSLWLSRFVFPCHPEMTIRPHVFPVAARLSQGQRIALAPSVLASVYRDLREMKKCLLNKGCGLKDGILAVWAPFHILQVWIWERFPGLRPETQNPVKDGEPRAARWHDVGKKLDLGLVYSVLGAPNTFHYRPYAISSSNWYKEGCDELIRDDELRSFAQCLCTCELVGVDTVEQYLPNRVAMQFGFDQDLPIPFSRVCNSGWEAAWRTYEITADNIGLYVPPQPFEPGVTSGYLHWWKEHMLPCCNTGIVGTGGVIPHIIPAKDNSKGKGKSGSRKAKVSSSPGDKKRKIQDCYDSTSVSEWSESKARNVNEIGTKLTKGTKGAKGLKLNQHVLIEETKDVVMMDGSGSAPDVLNPVRGSDSQSHVVGSGGDEKAVGFLEMKSITGDVLKKVVDGDTGTKQEEVIVEAGERNQEQAVIDRSEASNSIQPETITTQEVSAVTHEAQKITPNLPVSTPQSVISADSNLNLPTDIKDTEEINLNINMDGTGSVTETGTELVSVEEKDTEEPGKMATEVVEVGKEIGEREKIELDVDGREQEQGSDKNVERETAVGECATAELTEGNVNEQSEMNANNPEQSSVEVSEEKRTNDPKNNAMNNDLAMNEQPVPSRTQEEDYREGNPAVPAQVSRERISTRDRTGRVNMDRYAAELRVQRANKEAKELAEIKKLKQEIKDMNNSIMMLDGGPSLS